MLPFDPQSPVSLIDSNAETWPASNSALAEGEKPRGPRDSPSIEGGSSIRKNVSFHAKKRPASAINQDEDRNITKTSSDTTEEIKKDLAVPCCIPFRVVLSALALDHDDARSRDRDFDRSGTTREAPQDPEPLSRKRKENTASKEGKRPKLTNKPDSIAAIKRKYRVQMENRNEEQTSAPKQSRSSPLPGQILLDKFFEGVKTETPPPKKQKREHRATVQSDLDEFLGVPIESAIKTLQLTSSQRRCRELDLNNLNLLTVNAQSSILKRIRDILTELIWNNTDIAIITETGLTFLYPTWFILDSWAMVRMGPTLPWCHKPIQKMGPRLSERMGQSSERSRQEICIDVPWWMGDNLRAYCCVSSTTLPWEVWMPWLLRQLCHGRKASAQ